MGIKSRFYVDIMDLHNAVTGSCHLCVVKFPDGDSLKFLVDCGLFQDERSESLNSKLPFKAENIGFCLVTHNHVDHTGRIPLLFKNGFRGIVYASESTSELMRHGLYDSYRILKSKAKLLGESPLYSEEDVENALYARVFCNYKKTIKVHEHVRVTFFRNAHIPGAAIIFVQITYPGEENINLVFSGDYKKVSEFSHESVVPKWVLDLPVTLICESTYGYEESKDVVHNFDNNILKALEEGKTVLIPSFSLERYQKILYRLRCLQNEGKLDVNIPIYLDGKLALTYTNMYLRGILDIKPEMIDFLPKNICAVDKVLRRTLLYEDNTQKIIVTSSGKGSYGPARSYIQQYIGNPNILIHFTGYCAEGTLGRRIKDHPKGEDIVVSGIVAKKQADVEYTSEFSAHAKADELIEFIQGFHNLNLVLLNHGDPEVKELFAKRVLAEVGTKQVGILSSDYVFRIGPWGFIKSIPTKFI